MGTNFYQIKTKKPRRKSLSLKRGLTIIGLGGLFVLAFFIYFASSLPDPQKIDQRQVVESTKIFDRTGKILLYDIHGEEKRTIVPLEEISPYLKMATIAAEDVNFYNHFGLDFKGIARAVWGVITRNPNAGGGSTITQQFIKKSFFSDKRSYLRKIKEWILAIELERRYSKDEILGFYLNQIPYGSNAYGIEAAAQTFFNKSSKNLTLAESALLAALPQAPSRLSPYGSHPEDLKVRQEWILERLVKYNYVSREEAENAKKETLQLADKKSQNIKAPHFVMYVKEYLEEKYGEDYVEKSGFKVYTTLDWELQQAAETIVKNGAESNAKKYQAYNAALAAIDPKTGQILTMVGSRDYNAEESLPAGCTPGKTCRFEPYVNVTVRDRQPGSSFKPFAYATAFKKGYTPDTVLFDLKTEFNPNCPASANQKKDSYGLDCYNPGNYDDKFRGPVTLREALAQSLNIPAVKTLYLAGIEDTIKTAREMGITGLNADYYGLSLVLGGGEVKLLDQVAAYGVFAAEGKKYEKTAILKIEDASGKIIEEYKSQSKQALEPQYARLISSVLSDNAARSPVFGSNSSLYFADRPVAAKTGTTQEYRDAWTMGYTPSLAVGVWVGNNDNTSMARAGAGIAAAGPLWHDFIKKSYELKTNCDEDPLSFCLPSQPEQFASPAPEKIEKAILNGSYLNPRTYRVNKISGAPATENTPPELTEEKTFFEVHSILHYVKKNDPRGSYPENPGADPQYKNWEAAIAAWAAQHGLLFQQSSSGQDDSPRSPASIPSVKITFPGSGQIVGRNFTVQAAASADLGIKQIDFFLGDEFLGSSLSFPYQISVSLPASVASGQNILRARAYDSAFNRQEDQINVYVIN